MFAPQLQIVYYQLYHWSEVNINLTKVDLTTNKRVKKITYWKLKKKGLREFSVILGFWDFGITRHFFIYQAILTIFLFSLFWWDMNPQSIKIVFWDKTGWSVYIWLLFICSKMGVIWKLYLCPICEHNYGLILTGLEAICLENQSTWVY